MCVYKSGNGYNADNNYFAQYTDSNRLKFKCSTHFDWSKVWKMGKHWFHACEKQSFYACSCARKPTASANSCPINE